MNQLYAAVLADLRERKARLEEALKQLDAGINAIQQVGTNATVFIDSFTGPSTAVHIPIAPSPVRAEHARFANISVRWAVLWHLAEFSQGFEKTGEIAKALLAGGYQSEAARFPNLVSAVLSGMKSKVPAEVETNDDGGYRLTGDGRRTWELIRQGAKFRAATTSASEPTLLSVQ
jgi:hypothetical protein